MFRDPGLVAQVLMLRRYCGQPLSEPVLLIKSSGLVTWDWLLFRDWRSRPPQLQRVETGGLHGSMFEPACVAALAQAIQQFTRAHKVGGDKT